MQTILRHPHENARIHMTLGEINYCYVHHLDQVLTDQQLGLPAIHGLEVEPGYIRWFYLISNPRMILPDEDVQVPRPPEQEALDEIVVEQDGEHGYLDLVFHVQWCGGAMASHTGSFGRNFRRGSWRAGLSL